MGKKDAGFGCSALDRLLECVEHEIGIRVYRHPRYGQRIEGEGKLETPYDKIAKVPSFALKSDDIADGAQLPLAQVSGMFGAGGGDVSPHLGWSGFPATTKSFVVTVYDPFAPTASGFWHWAVADIPASVTELVTGAGDESGSKLPPGAWQLLNDGSVRRFIGAAPPVGHGRHIYYTAVHAIDIAQVGVGRDASPALLMFSIASHTVGRAVMAPWWEAK